MVDTEYRRGVMIPGMHALNGLTTAEADRRLRRDGPNELARRERGSFVAAALHVLSEPMILLLIAAGSVYLVLGDREEAILLLGSIAIIVGIEVYQERKTERAIEALRDLSSPRALVIRDGERRRIPGRDVVRGDLVVLGEGDRVPADGVLVACTNLSTDESLLTGESMPVRKVTGSVASEPSRPGGDDLPFVYSGSLVTSGQGVAEIMAVGSGTEMGRIGAALQSLTTERTRLQNETDRVVRRLAILAAVLCVVVAVGYGISHGSALEGLLAGITLAMSLIPEEFPVVLTVFLALGAWRIARNQVLTRRVPAIEALGAATVLCVDKTGTLTENRMSVAVVADTETWTELGDAASAISPDLGRLLELGVLASPPDPFDPMERAIRRAWQGQSGEPSIADMALVSSYPLSDRRLAMVNVWRQPGQRELIVAAKGAPEAIAELCTDATGEAHEALAARVRSMAEAGLRVLGVAQARIADREALPEDPRVFPLRFVGLIGLADPIRPSVPAAVAECHQAGIRVVMLTGDYPVTAQNVARRVGLDPPDAVMIGADLEAVGDGDLTEHAARTSVFARVRPEQKLRLVKALKSRGEIVAMTGDGVNDAPALKAADIGIAMGERGTDVAREAASLVLLDDDFASIVRAVRLGRRIFDNLRKSMAFLLAVHVPIAGLSLLPVLLGWPLVLLPVHIVFLELIIDPACSIAFESEREEPDVMQRPPRPVLEPLFTGRLVALSLVQGLGILLITAFILQGALARSLPEEDVRALTFVTLVVADLGLILANRSTSRATLRSLFTRNPALWLVLVGTSATLAVVLLVPSLRDLFHLGVLHWDDLAVVTVGSAIALLWLDAVKLVRGRIRQVV